MTASMRKTLFAVTLLSTLGAATAHAQDSPRFEVTPFVGYRVGGEFDAVVGTATPDVESSVAYGVALSMAAGHGRRFELLYSFQPTEIEHSSVDLDIEHLHLGGSATYLEGESLIPFIAGGIGVTRLKPDRGDDETRFSGSLALGVGVPISKRVHLRVEWRGYLVAMDGNSRIFCSGGTCLARASGDHLFQSEALAGIAIGFGL